MILLLGISFASSAQIKSAGDTDPVAVKVAKFFPNPATTAIHFDLAKGYDKSYTLQIYNFMGRKVSESSASTQRVSFSLNGLYRGVYIFQLRDQAGKIVDSGKFQVASY